MVHPIQRSCYSAVLESIDCFSVGSQPPPRKPYRSLTGSNVVIVKKIFRLDLRRLILILAFTTAAITLINGLHASYQVQRQLLIDQTLNSNRYYALKLAATTEKFFRTAQQQLKYSADEISARMDNPELLEQVANRLHIQTDSFNSVVIVDHSGKVLATSPDLHLTGSHLDSPGAIQALREQKPLISAPYLSNANNFLVVISYPIFSPDGTYLGYLGGSIYLKEQSILNELMGTHFYENESHLYVVDQNQRIIYHPDASRVGSQIVGNPAIDAVLAGESGARQIRNSRGTSMLAGYAPIGISHWGIVAQRPLESTLTSLNTQLLAIINHTLPLALITLLLIWWLARLISRPLWKLAASAQTLDQPDTLKRIQNVHSWYFESSELKHAMLLGGNLLHTRIGELKNDALTDTLTGLGNRRSAELSLRAMQEHSIPFSVLAIDIDHFKQVNDTFGHDSGDRALKALAQIIHSCTRKEDHSCRTGGEEFIILLPHANLNMALGLAERLRQKVADTNLPDIGHITISIGITEWPLQAETTDQLLKNADLALYSAKEKGRNRCEIYSTREHPDKPEA